MTHQWMNNMPHSQSGTSLSVCNQVVVLIQTQVLSGMNIQVHIIAVPLVYPSNSKLTCQCTRVLNYTSHNIVALHPCHQ